MGSYLDARHHQGRWLVRMEDLDRSRVIPGCAPRMLRTLERFALCWDGEVLWQSRRIDAYLDAARELSRRGLTFPCSCSRREHSPSGETGYPGTCRAAPAASGPTALRFRVPDEEVAFEDRIQGTCCFSLPRLGDFILVRKDGIPAYQLAVVVDDAEQGITDIVRGADLLESTAWQLALQNALALPVPRHAHLPLVVEPNEGKLSKSRRALPVDRGDATASLVAALRLLRHPPPPQLQHDTPVRVLEWALGHWDPDLLRGLRSVSLPCSPAL